VIEVNGRLGGGVPEMLFQASGVSLVQLSMRVALGEPVVVMVRSRAPGSAGAFCSSLRRLPTALSASEASTGWPNSPGSFGLRESIAR